MFVAKIGRDVVRIEGVDWKEGVYFGVVVVAGCVCLRLFYMMRQSESEMSGEC